jgi:N-acetylneuraminate synthase/pseudaminic acid synthase
MNIKIGKYIVGKNHPCFIVAEMSGNHNQSLSRAIKIIKAAKRAGANAIKLQTYSADTITLKCKKKDFTISKSSPWKKSKFMWNLYNNASTPWTWHKKLFSEAKKNNLEIFSSPFDESAVDLLEKLNCVAYKIASPEINHFPLLKRVAKTKKPVILSTGLSDFKDLRVTVNFLKKNGTKKIIILKCITSYPAKIGELNLKTIQDISQKFKCISGFSDHTKGFIAPLTAAILGASVIEKHFTLNDNKKTVDSFFSFKEKDFSEMVKNIRASERSIGETNYDISKDSKKSYTARRSIYFSRKIKKGEKITIDNIKVVRPAFSLSPKHYYKILGMRTKRNFNIGDRINLKDLHK